MIVRLRAVPDGDRASLEELWVRAWTPTLPGIDFEARRSWFLPYLDGLLAGGAWLLMWHEADRPVGFLTLHPATGTIDQIATDPAHAGLGLGRALMDEAKRLSPTGLSLTVNVDNGRAVSFYQAAGFTVSGEGVSERSGLPVLTMAWRG